jgi:hypothetical protein
VGIHNGFQTGAPGKQIFKTPAKTGHYMGFDSPNKDNSVRFLKLPVKRNPHPRGGGAQIKKRFFIKAVMVDDSQTCVFFYSESAANHIPAHGRMGTAGYQDGQI